MNCRFDRNVPEETSQRLDNSVVVCTNNTTIQVKNVLIHRLSIDNFAPNGISVGFAGGKSDHEDEDLDTKMQLVLSVCLREWIELIAFALMNTAVSARLAEIGV